MDTLQYVKWLRGSSPYINAHRDRTFVLMLGGEAIADPNFENIVHDIALLASLDVRLVMVFGARPQIDEAYRSAGIEARYQPQGRHLLRITDDTGIRLVRQVVGDLRIQIEALLSTGLPGSPMHASRITATGGNWVTARPLGVIDGIDFCHTGEIRRVDAVALRRQLDAGVIPLLGPMGYSPSGEVFNLAYEEVATAVAGALRADKLIALDEEPGLLDERGNSISEMTPRELEAMIVRRREADIAGDELLRQLTALLEASRAGVRRCHLVSHAIDGALLQELFTREGSGTQISEHSYEQLRPAHRDDVAGIVEITRPLADAGVLVQRSRELIEREIERFTVLELDGLVIGCAALYPYSEDQAAEIACVVTHVDFQGADRAEKLVGHLEQLARREGFTRTFVLTTRTSHWFVEQGYRPTTLESLPAARRSLWSPARNSKVLSKTL
ncbi:MAG: amino-acid N-acetyltransferase [Gammaproteobacteria bacterium]|nr:MAG: amino-acid N-acetyltransferase [Gammaproteobacteria bacterium]